MKKFITNNMSWLVLLLFAAAVAALVIALRNRRAIRTLPSTGDGFTAEQRAKILKVCDVENANTDPGIMKPTDNTDK